MCWWCAESLFSLVSYLKQKWDCSKGGKRNPHPAVKEPISCIMGSVNHPAAAVHEDRRRWNVQCRDAAKSQSIFQHFTNYYAHDQRIIFFKPAHLCLLITYVLRWRCMHIGPDRKTNLCTSENLIKAHTFFKLFYDGWRQCLHGWSQSCLFIYLHLKSGGL